MCKRIWAFAFSLWMTFSFCSSGLAQTFGPVSSYDELRLAFESAQDGDTILLSGDMAASADEPLSSDAFIHLKSENGAVVRGLHLHNAAVTFTGIALEDSLIVDGASHISLGSGVTVSGADGNDALSFTGSGALIVERGCEIRGGASAAGISIHHNGGEFYSSIEGSVSGGSGSSGGTGMIVSPLKEGGALMITGSIKGGSGASLGGHALNLYDLSGNAYITVSGTLQGGDGAIGGDGIQVVSAGDQVNVGISGQVKGGQGESYGGNGLILMSAEGACSINLSGHFSGGDATGEDAQPGTSLQLVGDSAALRARIDDCILEDGRHLRPTPVPTSEPTPEPTPDAALPEDTEAPVEPTPADPVETPQPDPSPVPDADPEPVIPEDTPADIPEDAEDTSDPAEGTPGEANEE